MIRIKPLLCASFGIFCIPFFCIAAPHNDVRILDAQGNIVTIFTPFSDSNALISSVASADLGHDGTAEIIVGSGEDSNPTVSVFRQDGSRIGVFDVYNTGYRGGVNVAACDVDNDGTAEIITGAAWNGGPHVQIYSNMGKEKYPGFFVFNEAMTSGINVACGDVTGDGIGDIIVSASVGGGPAVKVFSVTGTLLTEVFIDSALKNSGAAIALSDADHDGIHEILTSTMDYNAPNIVTWKYNVASASLVAIHSDSSLLSSSKTLIAPVGIDDTSGKMLFATQGHTEPSIQSTDKSVQITPFSSGDTHAVGAAIISESGVQAGFVAADIAPHVNDDISPKSIVVDISQERLTAYEYGIPVYTFPVSTAKKGFVTPLGKTSVSDKLLYHDYKWNFGVGNPNNYFVPHVKWNLRIYDHIYIHWAYWHNNFGHPMSHGCVNANATNMAWIYDWTDVGTPVNIQN